MNINEVINAINQKYRVNLIEIKDFYTCEQNNQYQSRLWYLKQYYGYVYASFELKLIGNYEIIIETHIRIHTNIDLEIFFSMIEKIKTLAKLYKEVNK